MQLVRQIIMIFFLIQKLYGDAEYYRKETEKILRKKIKADKESDSANMISLEDIANKFNIDINKLIIKGI